MITIDLPHKSLKKNMVAIFYLVQIVKKYFFWFLSFLITLRIKIKILHSPKSTIHLNANLINLIIFGYEQHLTLTTDNSATASEPYKGFIPTLGNR